MIRPQNKLTINKTAGSYVRGVYRWRIIGTDTYPAPKNFGDIKFSNGGVTTQVTQLFPGPNGLAAEAVTAVASANGNAWSYALNVNALGGSGTDSDPFIGIDTDVKAGDTFSICSFRCPEPVCVQSGIRPGLWRLGGGFVR